MRKIVNVIPRVPINTVRPPILRTLKSVDLSVGDILACLLTGAVVEEVLPNGDIIRLNNVNYNKELVKPLNNIEKHTAKIKGVNDIPKVEINEGEKIMPSELSVESDVKLDSELVSECDKTDEVDDVNEAEFIAEEQCDELPTLSEVEEKHQNNKKNKNKR